MLLIKREKEIILVKLFKVSSRFEILLLFIVKHLIVVYLLYLGSCFAQSCVISLYLVCVRFRLRFALKIFDIFNNYTDRKNYAKLKLFPYFTKCCHFWRFVITKSSFGENFLFRFFLDFFQ